MSKVTCIKTVSTKGGTTFTKGQSYGYVVDNTAIRVYATDFKFTTIKSESLFNKYFV
mgnify:CR=1 FL=1|jgi:hypothetical protein